MVNQFMLYNSSMKRNIVIYTYSLAIIEFS
jgi:hypothetical protein